MLLRVERRLKGEAPMRRRLREILIVGSALVALAACGQSNGQQNGSVGYGANPQLPKPSKTLLPTVKLYGPFHVTDWLRSACCPT